MVDTPVATAQPAAPAAPAAQPAPTFLDDPKALAGIAYLAGGIGGYGFGDGGYWGLLGLIIPLAIYFHNKGKKNDPFLAFCSFQAFLWTLVVVGIGFVFYFLFVASLRTAYYDPIGYYAGGGLGASLGLIGLFGMVGFVIMLIDLFLAFKAYSGEKVKLPVIGGMAEHPFL
ncbi:DUF4870 domain-containing protein [Candidatus Micrarchaeota archaeon]|nr:DUF4870 domain-containing protein [Candidatus Micrarchaeota archaeon]